MTEEQKTEKWTNAVIAGDTELGLQDWLEENYREYSVTVDRSVVYTHTFVVEATCVEDAEEEALHKASNFDYSGHTPSGVEYTIDNMEVSDDIIE